MFEGSLRTKFNFTDLSAFDTMIMKASFYSVSFALTRKCNQLCAPNSGEIVTF